MRRLCPAEDAAVFRAISDSQLGDRRKPSTASSWWNRSTIHPASSSSLAFARSRPSLLMLGVVDRAVDEDRDVAAAV